MHNGETVLDSDLPLLKDHYFLFDVFIEFSRLSKNTHLKRPLFLTNYTFNVMYTPLINAIKYIKMCIGYARAMWDNKCYYKQRNIATKQQTK